MVKSITTRAKKSLDQLCYFCLGIILNLNYFNPIDDLTHQTFKVKLLNWGIPIGA